MNIPKLPSETKPFLWGAAAGAIALAFVGFNWGGWVTGGTAEKLAGARADDATVAALTPICVAQFQKGAKARASLAVLKETKTWEQGDYVSKNGWATMPGSTAEPKREVATACAEALNKLVP
jgi:alpha/beta superfamily hydrolase